MESYIMLACSNIKNELLRAALESNTKFPIFFIPENLHLSPKNLQAYLQNTIDSIENVDYILLPMGMCGNGTIGLTSKRAKLVLPKCNDCIDLLMSDYNIKKERPEYSFFLTEGWLGHKHSIDTEYKYTIEKYGKERGMEIIGMIYNNYKYFTFLDTGAYNLNKAKAYIKPLAETANMEINVIKGEYGVLKKMVMFDFDHNFIIIPQGEPVCDKHFSL